MNKIEQWMNSRIGLNFRSGLDRMEQAVSLLGRPDKAYPILHVTGTNGKGSTIAFLRQLLMAHGKKVGTFTSPHMISIHDRICIGDQPISDEDFTRIGQEVQQMEQTLLQTQDQLSYFEIICLMALLYFKEQAVDVVLLVITAISPVTTLAWITRKRWEGRLRKSPSKRQESLRRARRLLWALCLLRLQLFVKTEPSNWMWISTPSRTILA